MKRTVAILCLVTMGCGQVDKPAIKPLFDIPSLIGKNADQVKDVWGKPEEDDEPTKKQLQLGVDEWNWQFKNNGYNILLTYDPKTRVVKDFFIDATNHNCDSIIYIANLKENSPKYSITHQAANVDPNNYLGIKVTPK